MTKKGQKVNTWRDLTKKLMVESLGGKCCICNYNKCMASLVFHHLEPDSKDFALTRVLVSPRKWEDIVKELRKCVLICSNCHGEIHHGDAFIPENAPRFDENFKNRDPQDLEEKSPCIICGKLKSTRLIACSRTCAAKNAGRINWDLYSLEKLKVWISEYTYEQIGEFIGCSDAAVIKRAKKLGIYIQKLKLNTSISN